MKEKERSLSSISEQVAAVRARIEAEVATPASILVTSAKASDGKTATAASLASNLAMAGYRVLLVDASRSTRLDNVVGPRRLVASAPSEALEFVRSRSEGGEDVLNLTDGELAENLSADAIRAFMPLLKERYDYILIDSSEYLTSTPALLFGSIVDGVLITVRKGRAAVPDDIELGRALDASRIKVIGVLPVAPKAIRDIRASQLSAAEYDVRVPEAHFAERPQARTTTSIIHSG